MAIDFLVKNLAFVSKKIHLFLCIVCYILNIFYTERMVLLKDLKF